MLRQTLTRTTHSAHETHTLGEKLGRLLQGGEVICLEGQLGTGKTCLVQGIAEGMEVTSHFVSSPTFTLHHEYHGRIPLHHLDLYRIEQPEEIEKLGLLELLDDEKGVVVIEWAEKIQELLPEERLAIRIWWENENTRRFELHASGQDYCDLLKRFEDQSQSNKP